MARPSWQATGSGRDWKRDPCASQRAAAMSDEGFACDATALSFPPIPDPRRPTTQHTVHIPFVKWGNLQAIHARADEAIAVTFCLD